MTNEELVESLVKLNISSNERLGRVNEIVNNLTSATTQLIEASNNERSRSENLMTIFDKHLTELEANRDLILKESQRLAAHCDKITDMMERCQKMQAKCLDTIAQLSSRIATSTPINNIQIGDENES